MGTGNSIDDRKKKNGTIRGEFTAVGGIWTVFL